MRGNAFLRKITFEELAHCIDIAFRETVERVVKDELETFVTMDKSSCCSQNHVLNRVPKPYQRIEGTIMITFFDTGRRRLGILTLTIACLLMAGWIRSLAIGEIFRVSSSHRTYHMLFSYEGWIGWIVFHDPDVITPEAYRPFYSRASSRSESPFAWVCLHWDSKRNQFQEISGAHNPYLIVPYWFVVAPLTLLSAWLLLATPRSFIKPQPNTEIGSRQLQR